VVTGESAGCGEIVPVPVELNATQPRSEEPVEPASRRPAVPSWLPPLVLACAWLVVLVVNLRTPVPSDQLNYLEAADRFPHPVEGATQTHQVTRFGLIVPAHLAIMVFGYSQAAYATVPILSTLLLLAGTYALGTVLFSRTVGAAGALVVVAATPVFTDSTDLLPDVLATGVFACALAMAVSIGRREDPPGRVPLLVVGVLLGWSYLAREFVVFMWPVVLVLLYRRARIAGMLWVALPVAAIGAAEMLLCWRLYGDPLARVMAVLGHGNGPSTPAVAATYRDKPLMVYVMRLPDTLRTYPEGDLLVALIVLTLVGGAVRFRRMAVPLVTFALMWVPLTLLGGVLNPGAPKLRLQLIRYWFPVFPAFVIGGLGLLWLAGTFLAGRLPRPGPVRAVPPVVVPAAVVLVAAVATSGIAARHWWAAPPTRAGGATQLESLRSWMHDHDGTGSRLWADDRTARVVQVYQDGAWGGQSWSTPILVARSGGTTPRTGDLFLLFDAESGRVCEFCRTSGRALLRNGTWAGPGWREVYQTRDHVVRVFRLDGEVDPVRQGRSPSGAGVPA
jgi:hypothetical protein